MDHTFCPGSRLLRHPAPELFPCPSCGDEVEIWTDELKGICPSCKKTVFRDGGLSCLDWCKYGKDCVGDAAYDAYVRNKAVGVRAHLLEKIEQFYGGDRPRIEHAKAAMRFAEEILKREKADWHVVVPAAILHDVGIKAAEEKYGSSEACYRAIEGPPVARGILLKLGFQLEDIDEICAIVGHRRAPGAEESDNFKVVHDADRLANLSDAAQEKSPPRPRQEIERLFLTEAGKDLAFDTCVTIPVK